MTCVIILGVPRSGTSALAGAIAAMGVCMGERLMPPLAGVNDRGFFEDEDFVGLHIELMRSHEDPQILFDVPEPPDSQVLARYTSLIREREKQEWWGVKDPKLCFLLPYFLRRLNGPYKILMTRRPFHESVQSMQHLYGGMTLDRAAHLLGRYLYALDKSLAAVPGERLLPVSYHVLVGADAHPFLGEVYTREYQFARIANFLDLPGDPNELCRAGARFIDPTLRRQR